MRSISDVGIFRCDDQVELVTGRNGGGFLVTGKNGWNVRFDRILQKRGSASIHTLGWKRWESEMFDQGGGWRMLRIGALAYSRGAKNKMFLKTRPPPPAWGAGATDVKLLKIIFHERVTLVAFSLGVWGVLFYVLRPSHFSDWDKWWTWRGRIATLADPKKGQSQN